MTASRVDTLRAILAAMTPRPWRVHGTHPFGPLDEFLGGAANADGVVALRNCADELLAVVARAERVKGFCESESVTLYDPAGGKPCGTCRFCALRTALDALDARIAALPDGGDHG